MSENIRYHVRLGDYEQELEVPVSQFSSDKMTDFTAFLLNQIKRDLTNEDKKVKEGEDEEERSDK